MNSNKSAYRKLKQLQKALKLTDNDTGLINEAPDLTQQPQPQQAGPKQEDLALYEEMFSEALQRQFPLRESERNELEYYRQVFHIPQEKSLEIEQRVMSQMQLPSDPMRPLNPPLRDQLPETSMPGGEPTQIPNQPTAMGGNAPTIQTQGASANREAILGAAKQRLEANQAMLGQTLPPNDQPRRSHFEPKQTEPTAGHPPLDTTNQSATTHTTGFVNPDPQVATPHTVGQGSGVQVSTPGLHPFSSTSAVSPQPSTPAGTNSVAMNPGRGETPASAPTPRKAVIDKRLALPLVALFCGLTALGVILWMSRSSLLSTRKPDPQAAEQLVKVGAERNQKAEYREAISNFNEALRYNPNSIDAYINRGYAHHQSGDLNAAANDYQRALKLDSNSAVAYNNLSHVQADQGKYDEALKSAEQAIVLQRNLPEAHLNMGLALLALNEPEKALQKFQETLQLPASQMTHAKAFNNIGNVYAARNQLEEAGKQYDQALQRYPNYAEASYNRGMIFEQLKNRQAAIQDFTHAAKLYQDQNRDRLATQAKRRAEQLQQADANQPNQSPNPNSKAI